MRPSHTLPVVATRALRAPRPSPAAAHAAPSAAPRLRMHRPGDAGRFETYDAPHISTDASWTGLGFCSAPPASALGGNSNSDRFSNNPTGYAWMLYDQSQQIVTYEGPKAGVTNNGAGGPYTNSFHTLSVVIDTTGRATEGDENEAGTFQAFYRHTGMRLKQLGIPFVIIDPAGDPTPDVPRDRKSVV